VPHTVCVYTPPFARRDAAYLNAHVTHTRVGQGGVLAGRVGEASAARGAPPPFVTSVKPAAASAASAEPWAVSSFPPTPPYMSSATLRTKDRRARR
jgi:hypothetical protein